MDRWLLLAPVVLIACGGDDDRGDDDDDDDDDDVFSTTPRPELSFSLASSGAFAVSYTFGDEQVSGSGGWSGDKNDCTNVVRGLYAYSEADGVAADLYISGCTVLSAGGPPITVPAQLSVTSIDADERWASNYYDGAAGEAVDGCEVDIAEVFPWEESPFFDEHLFVSGSYRCDTLFSGFGPDDTEITVSPGSFTVDWTGSDVSD